MAFVLQWAICFCAFDGLPSVKVQAPKTLALRSDSCGERILEMWPVGLSRDIQSIDEREAAAAASRISLFSRRLVARADMGICTSGLGIFEGVRVRPTSLRSMKLCPQYGFEQQ